jgi:hypothetical protein
MAGPAAAVVAAAGGVALATASAAATGLTLGLLAALALALDSPAAIGRVGVRVNGLVAAALLPAARSPPGAGRSTCCARGTRRAGGDVAAGGRGSTPPPSRRSYAVDHRRKVVSAPGAAATARGLGTTKHGGRAMPDPTPSPAVNARTLVAAQHVRLLAAAVDIVADGYAPLEGEAVLTVATTTAAIALLGLSEGVPEQTERALADLAVIVAGLPAPALPAGPPAPLDPPAPVAAPAHSR